MTDIKTEESAKKKEGAVWNDLFTKSKLTKRTSIKSTKHKEKNLVDTLIKMMSELMNKNEEMMDESRDMKKEIQTLNKKIEQLDKKRENKTQLSITGVEIKTDEEKALRDDMEKFMNKEIKMKVKNSIKIENKISLIEMDSMIDKVQVLKNKYYIRYKVRKRNIKDKSVSQTKNTSKNQHFRTRKKLGSTSKNEFQLPTKTMKREN